MYATVKPYNLSFIPETQIPRNNMERREVSVSISDLRGSEQLFSLNRNGFMVLEFQSPHNDVDWDNKTSVKEVHYPKIVSEVERVVPGARCVPLHHKVSSKLCG